MVTLPLLIGVMPLLINGNDRYLSCLKNEWPGVKPFNLTHIEVSWSFKNCDDSSEFIDFEHYEIKLDGQSLGRQEHVSNEYSAVIQADPCLGHDVVITLWVHNKNYDEETQTTKKTLYNNMNATDCSGEGNEKGEEKGNGEGDNQSTQRASSEGVFIALCVISSIIILGTVAATTFCFWKRRQKSQNKEKEVIDEDENPVYGLYQV